MNDGSVRGVSVALFALGASTLVTQTVFLRELPAAFAANELTIGATLAVWMLLTGLGAVLARIRFRTSAPRRMSSLINFSAAAPPALLYALHALRNTVAEPGVSPGLGTISVSAVVMLAPFCLSAGSLFPILAGLARAAPGRGAGARAYALEAAGSAAGVLVFALLLADLISGYMALFFSGALLFLASAGFSHADAPLAPRITALALAAVYFAIPFVSDMDFKARVALFPGLELLSVRDTPYGVLATTGQGGQRTLFVDGVVFAASDMPMDDEETVHYAMAQHPRPRRVLLMGGDYIGVSREILKYGDVEVTVVEINPWIRRALGEADGASIVTADPRRWVRERPSAYDVILLNLPEPSTAAINRCFTVEFFADARAALREGGVLSVPALGGMDYHGEDTRSYLSTLYRSLARHFPHVMMMTGLRTFLLASDRPLVQDVPALIEERGIETMYVNRYYLDAGLMARRAAGLSASLDSEAPVNSDFRPLAFHRTLRSWLASFGISSWMPALFFVPLVVLLFRRRDARRTGVAAAGFACAGLQVMALLSFQSLNGSLHRDLGVLFAVFMAGMAAGSGIPWRRSGSPVLRRLSKALAVAALLAVLSPWLLEAARSSGSHFARYAVPMLINAGAGAAAGRAFALAIGRAGGIREGKTLTSLYAADLTGAAAGTFLASVYLVPLLGIFSASYLMGAVLLAAAVTAALAGRLITAPA